MAKIEVEVGEDGSIGAMPDELQRHFDRKVTESVKTAEKNLEAKLKSHIADPAEKERLKLLEEENSRLKEAEARAKSNFEEADRLKEERYQKQLEERDGKLTAKEQEIARRDTRLRSMLGAEVRAAATAAGARTESLAELVTLIGASLDLDPDTLEPFVKGADNKPLEKDGKRVSIDAHVQQYLADHPHHLGANRGKSGRAPGGAHLRGVAGGEQDDAIAAAEETPSAKNVTSAISSIRKKSSAA